MTPIKFVASWISPGSDKSKLVEVFKKFKGQDAVDAWDSLCYNFAYGVLHCDEALKEVQATLRDHTLNELMGMRKDERKDPSRPAR